MILGKTLFLAGVLYKVLPPMWRGGKWWFETMKRNEDPPRPKPWKIHNRMSGWTGVILLLIFAGGIWLRVHEESGFFRIYYVSLSVSMLWVAAFFAYLQNKVWRRGRYFGRLQKVGPLDGLL